MAAFCTASSAMAFARPTSVRATAAAGPAPARLHLLSAPRRGAALVARAAEGESESEPEAPAGPVVMKPTKFSDFASLTVEEIDAEVEAAKLEMFFMRNKQATRQEVKTSNFPVLRRKVAQLLTAKRQKFADMNKREFRSMERGQMLEAGEFVR